MSSDREPGQPESVPPTPDWDPVFLRSRREAVIVVAAWVVFLGWVSGYAAWRGYGGDEASADEPVAMVLGMPAWIFWGVAVPWFCATVFTVVFSLAVVRDEPFDGPLSEDEKLDGR